jgi:hypothetical protein
VKVCFRWHKFELFLEDMGMPPGDGYEIDRIDPDGHYQPENCQWVPKKEQLGNRSSTQKKINTKPYDWLEDWTPKMRSQRYEKHGMTGTRPYNSYRNMIQRCMKKGTSSYHYYGAKGVKISLAWQESFLAFFEDMGECPPGYSLDRIDPQGHYEKGNCRWASPKEQLANRSKSKAMILTVPADFGCEDGTA